jgi:lipopolysaccharide export system protein LptA
MVLVVCIFGIMVMLGGDDNTANDNTMPVLSGNEVLSRNQANIFSDVTNNYLDCMGAGSCIVTDNGQVITTTHTTNAPMTVDGDRNNITYTAAGRPICPNPNDPTQAGDVAEWCAAIGVQMP